MKSIAVAIDGPSGAGKSTIARAVAERLGFVYVDTGAMYRTIGLAVCRAGVQLGDTAGILPVLPGIGVSLNYQDGVQHVLLNGEDVSGLIRTPEMSKYASFVSAVPEVRAFLLDTQRDMAKKCSVIMDGRDIGTVILPDAEVKIFLTASPEVRAKRRTAELEAKGQTANYEKVLKEIQQRDYQDSHRAIAPLKQAKDAVKVDTSELDIDGVVATIRKIVEGKIGQ